MRLFSIILLAFVAGLFCLSTPMLGQTEATKQAYRILPTSVQNVPQPKATTPLLYLSRVRETTRLNSYLEVLTIADDDTLTFNNIIAAPFSEQFVSSGENIIPTLKTWVRFSVVNDIGRDARIFLESRNWDYVTLYTPAENNQFDVRKTGWGLPFNSWDVPRSHERGTLNELWIDEGKQITAYVELYNEDYPPSALELLAVSPTYLDRWDHTTRFGQGIFIGLLLFVGLFHLFVFGNHRDNIYLSFILYLGSALLFWMVNFGYAYESLWPNSPNWNKLSGLFFFALMVVAFIQFTRRYLRTVRSAPQWDKVLTILSWGIVALPFLRIIIGPVVNVWTVLLPATLLVYTVAFIINLQVLEKRYPPAIFFMAANLLWILGGLIYIFGQLQVISNTSLVPHAVQIGTVLQVMLFSLGLMDRRQQIRQAKVEMDIAYQRQLAERERREADRLRKMDKLKDEFLANTSHELRTPLNGMIGIAESLSDGVAGRISGAMRGNLNMIISSGKRLANLINDILDFSKLRADVLEIKKQPVDFKAVVTLVMELSKPLLQDKQLSLSNRIPDDIPAVLGDENRLQQIMHNLLGNAIKFTEQGLITVTAGKNNNGMLEVMVSDTGIGIAKEKLPLIFNAFAQADQIRSREYGGTGLGLSITRQLVELHGGKISVESRVGKGTTFRFLLPVTAAKIEKSVSAFDPVLTEIRDLDEPRESAPINGQLRNVDAEFKILIVDDEPINRQVLMNHLAFDNYHISQAFNGEEAWKIIRSGERFDLILLDIMMPKMTGYEASLKIREMYLPNELPIIMLTSKNQVSDLIEGLSSGANDYLTKPFSKNELLARVKTHLNLKMINSAYARFIPHEFLRTLGRDSIVDVLLGDQVQGEMTVLFSDIRGFTSLSEKMSPKENFDFLNEYLNYVTPSIRKHRGFIDKYIGDAVMAIFPGDPEDAVKAAIDMIKQLSEYNKLRQSRGDGQVKISIGLHTGKLMLGTIGDEGRMDGTVISDAVNLASRLEGLTKKYGASIIISEDAMIKVSTLDNYHYRPLGKVQVKGKRDAVNIFEIFDGENSHHIKLKVETQSRFEEGMRHYYERNFAEAVVCFKKVLDANPDDKTAGLYLENSAQYVVTGVPANWQGVEEMNTK